MRSPAAVLREAGAEPTGAANYLADKGRREVARVLRAAEGQGVFGLPNFILDGELFWGRKHLPDSRNLLAAA